MSSVDSHLKKVREERYAREKARIEKLRELNLKKYNKNVATQPPPSTSKSVAPASSKTYTFRPTHVKNNFHVNGTSKRPITAPFNSMAASTRLQTISRPNTTITAYKDTKDAINVKKDVKTNNNKPQLDKPKTLEPKINKIAANIAHVAEMSSQNHDKASKMNPNGDKILSKHSIIEANIANVAKMSSQNHEKASKMNPNGDKIISKHSITEVKPKPQNSRKSMLPIVKGKSNLVKPDTRKSMPFKTEHSKVDTNGQSVFERLYQPKTTIKQPLSEVSKMKNDPDFVKNAIKNTGLILSKRHTMFEPKKIGPPVRRSISAVHFKRICQSELKNCIKKWSSIGEKIDKAHLKHVNEDALVQEDKIVSAVKSDCKKVKFQNQSFNFNTPRPEDLQRRLQNWLQKRGKSIDSYHHLQCFGIHHLVQRPLKPLNLEQSFIEPEMTNHIEDDEDKENVPLQSDSDNESFTDVMNEDDFKSPMNFDGKWRHASMVSDSVDLNETRDTLSSEPVHHIYELMLGALNDLTELLKEGFDWEQCARWLRAIRHRFPSAPNHAAYWECRAALEERRGDFGSSVECWEEAVAKGTEHSVVEANLDQLLNKFMQLEISPSGHERRSDPKLVDIKNVFKSTLIRFVVQQAKIRQSQEPAKFTVTPVRRSGRLSTHPCSVKKTPLQICTSVRQASLLGLPVKFVPNTTLTNTP